MIVCPNCGEENPLDSRYCERCGRLLASSKKNKFADNIDSTFIGGISLIIGGCFLTFIVYKYFGFIWVISELYKDNLASTFPQFHNTFFYYAFRTAFFGGAGGIMLCQGYLISGQE